MALGVVGYSVALIFVLYGAPDLAMTQFLIETLSLILFVFVFYYMPPFKRFSTQSGDAAARGHRHRGGCAVHVARAGGDVGAMASDHFHLLSRKTRI